MPEDSKVPDQFPVEPVPAKANATLQDVYDAIHTVSQQIHFTRLRAIGGLWPQIKEIRDVVKSSARRDLNNLSERQP